MTLAPAPPPLGPDDLVDADVLASAWSVDLDWNLTHLRHQPLCRNPCTAPLVTIHPGQERRAQAWRRLFSTSRTGCWRTVLSRRRDLRLSWVVPALLRCPVTGLPVATAQDYKDYARASCLALQA